MVAAASVDLYVKIEGLVAEPAYTIRIRNANINVGEGATFASFRKLSSRASICACSDGPITSRGAFNECAAGNPGKSNLLMTAHHIGTVFDKASGMLLPRLVESTTIQLPCSND